jgi:hypothetical protein
MAEESDNGYRPWAWSSPAISAARSTFSAASASAGDDRVGVRPVEIAEAYAVVGYPGVVHCLLQLPGGFAQVNAAVAGFSDSQGLTS